MGKSLVEQFIENTSGGRDAGRALLREFIFRENTGRWPTHLKRNWREWTVDGVVRTWEKK